MADADGDQFHRAAALHHRDYVAQVFFQIDRRVHRQRRVVHRRAVRDHHEDFALLRAGEHPAMRPFQRLAVDILLQQAFLHHQAQIGPRPTHRRIGALVDDVAQVVEATRALRAAIGEPFLTALTAFPGACGEAEDLDLHVAAL